MDRSIDHESVAWWEPEPNQVVMLVLHAPTDGSAPPRLWLNAERIPDAVAMTLDLDDVRRLTDHLTTLLAQVEAGGAS